MKIFFTGGGTGGHVYPALSIIDELLKDKSLANDEDFEKTHRKSPLVGWLGQRGGVEERLIAEYGIPFYGISAGKLRRYFSLQNFTDLFKIVLAFFQARAILKTEKPDLLFSKGGFVSLPPVVASYSLKIPVFIHESDSDSGLANRLAAPFARKIFVPYDETVKSFKLKYQNKVEVSGNPVRSDVAKGEKAKGRSLYNLKEDDFFILVLGGSSGAKQVNDLITEIAPSLLKDEKVFILHQMGANLFQASQQNRYVTVPYIKEELPHLLAGCDVVVSRAGAGAIWEFATLGVVPIFIPLGMRGDQSRNALLLQKKGACRVLGGENATPEQLLQTLNELKQDESLRSSMSLAIKDLIKIDSKAFIADKIKGYLRDKTGGSEQAHE